MGVAESLRLATLESAQVAQERESSDLWVFYDLMASFPHHSTRHEVSATLIALVMPLSKGCLQHVEVKSLRGALIMSIG